MKIEALRTHISRTDVCIEQEWDNRYTVSWDDGKYSEEYLVLTDFGAERYVTETIKESLWAFTPSFLHTMTGLDTDVFKALANTDLCESLNPIIRAVVDSTCGLHEFVSTAVEWDGRGHFLATYNGEEHEVTIKGSTYYIYRTN